MNIEIKMKAISDLCPHCLGLGKLKIMRSAMTYDRGSIRAKDSEVECRYCKGKGFIK